MISILLAGLGWAPVVALIVAVLVAFLAILLTIDTRHLRKHKLETMKMEQQHEEVMEINRED